jgi:hypothetical protein
MLTKKTEVQLDNLRGLCDEAQSALSNDCPWTNDILGELFRALRDALTGVIEDTEEK